MEVTELDGRVSPVPTAPAIVGSNRVAPAPVDLEQGGEPPPAGTDVDAELQLMQQAAGSTTASDQPHSGSMLASKSSIKSAQAAWLEIRQDATELPHAVRQKVRPRACSAPRVSRHVHSARAPLQVLFQYMCPDTVCVHGLRDWSVEEWARALEQQPQAAAQFLLPSPSPSP